MIRATACGKSVVIAESCGEFARERLLDRSAIVIEMVDVEALDSVARVFDGAVSLSITRLDKEVGENGRQG